MADMPTIKPVSTTDQVLSMLGQKLSNGQELTMAESLMAMSAAARTKADVYGPGPATMQLQRPQLPEDVKGILANYSGV